jgi:hypothetical protein
MAFPSFQSFCTMPPFFVIYSLGNVEDFVSLSSAFLQVDEWAAHGTHARFPSPFSKWKQEYRLVYNLVIAQLIQLLE